MNDQIVSAAALGRALGLSRARITQLKSEGLPFVRTDHGDRFKLVAACRWYMAHVAGRDTPEPAAEISDLDRARARKAHADARLAELALAERLGRVVAIEDVVLVISQHIAAARSRLLAMPATLGPILAAEDTPAGCQQILDAAVREALEELAGTGFDGVETKQRLEEK